MLPLHSEYWSGLNCGLIALAFGVHDAQWSHDVSAVHFAPDAFREGYRDALDDSDDMPNPFDPERTLVP